MILLLVSSCTRSGHYGQWSLWSIDHYHWSTIAQLSWEEHKCEIKQKESTFPQSDRGLWACLIIWGRNRNRPSIATLALLNISHKSQLQATLIHALHSDCLAPFPCFLWLSFVLTILFRAVYCHHCITRLFAQVNCTPVASDIDLARLS